MRTNAILGRSVCIRVHLWFHGHLNAWQRYRRRAIPPGLPILVRLAAVAAPACLIRVPAYAAVTGRIRFEPPVYTVTADIAGVDGWSTTSGAGVVTPDPHPPGSGYLIVMEGDQSFVHFSGGSYRRPWPAGSLFETHSVVS